MLQTQNTEIVSCYGCNLRLPFPEDALVCRQCNLMLCKKCIPQSQMKCSRCQSTQFTQLTPDEQEIEYLGDNYQVDKFSFQRQDQIKGVLFDLQKISSIPMSPTIHQLPVHQPKHIIQNGKIDQKCRNNFICKQQVDIAYEKELLCGIECAIFQLISQMKKDNDFKDFNQKIDDIIDEFHSRNYLTKFKAIPHQDLNFSVGPQQFRNDHQKCIVKFHDQSFLYRSVYSAQGFQQNEHYWEINIDKNCEFEPKIGISKELGQCKEQSFSDLKSGWAYIGKGQLRHGDNSKGDKYGEQFKHGIIGVYLNMVLGQLSFSLDGKCFGIAFENEYLKHGPIYPAVSLMRLGSFTYNYNQNIPDNFPNKIMK